MTERTGQCDPHTLGVAAAIVNYEGAAMILEALPDLLAELEPFASQHVFIVDNASPNGDGALLQERLVRDFCGAPVTLIRSPVNGGFAAGNNIAFAAAAGLSPRPDAVFLLNPDAAVRPGAVRRLAETMMAKPRAAIVAPAIENPDGTLMRGAFHFPTLMREFARAASFGPLYRRFPTTWDDVVEPTRVDWVTGAAQLVRSEAIDAVDGMDAGFFLYYEEMDMARRLHDLGWESWHVPAARVFHIGGASTGVEGGLVRRGRMPSWWFDSWSRYFIRHHGPAYARATAGMRTIGHLVGRVIDRLRSRPRKTPQNYLRDFAAHCVLKGGAAARRPRMGVTAVDLDSGRPWPEHGA